jgi:hypothetical protein
VNIGAERFDLKQGGVFLVDPQGGKLSIDPMAIDFSNSLP